MLIRYFLSYLALFLSFTGITQTLTISSAGQTGTSGTNWALSNGVLTVSGTANVHPNVISTQLGTNALLITGSTSTFNVTISNSIAVSAGSNLLTIGSVNNNGDVLINAALSFNAGFVVNSNTIQVNNNITISTASDLTLNCNTGFSTATTTRYTLSTAGGNITIHADKDANGSGTLDLDYLTFNPGSGTTIIRGETVSYSVGSIAGPYINGTGSFTFESSDASFTPVVNTSWFEFDQDGNGMAGLTIGKTGNTTSIIQNTNISVAGPVNYYGGAVTFNGNLTTTASGDIFVKAISNGSPSIALSSGYTISKTSGSGTLTFQGNSNLSNSGTITTSGSAVLNVVFWSDYDNTNNDGGVSHAGSISTNGGHVWMGGSNSNGGSYTWNNLSVGDGPSIGSTNYNVNGMDIFGPITTNGGDLLLWAGNGVTNVGYFGIATNSGHELNVGNGDIVLITPYVLGVGPSLFFRQSGGTFTLVPNGTAFPNSLNWTPTLGAYGSMTGWNFPGDFNYLWIENPTLLTNISLGYFDGMTSNGSPVVMTNSSSITIGTAMSIAGPISIYGGDIAVNQNLTSTLSGADVLLQATGAISLATSKVIQTANGDITLKATANGVGSTSSSAIYLYDGSDLLSNGGNITLGGGYAGTQGNLYAASIITGGGYALRLNSGVVINASGGNIAMYGRNVTSYGDGVYMDGVSITTTGAGTIGIYGDSYGGFTSGTSTYFGGITFENSAATIQTTAGNITLEGILTNSQSTQGYAINFYRSPGSPGQTKHIQILSQTGNIQITANRGTSIGNGIGHSSWGHIYFGSPADNSFTASGNVKLSYSGFVGAVNHGFKVKTTGGVTYEPAGVSFDAALTFPLNSNHVLADGASSLTLGKDGNASGLTIGSNVTVAGPLNIYGNALALNANLSTTNTSTGNMLLQCATISGSGNISIAAGRTATLNLSSPTTYSGVISGVGSSVTKSGAGQLTLTNDNTYSGATNINAGDLQVGTGGSVSAPSSGTISATSLVAVASGSKLILSPNENVTFSAPISGSGGVEVRGASGTVYNAAYLSATPVTIATNSTVLEVLTRLTGGVQQGSAISGAQTAAVYQKVYNAATNTATLQFQQFEGTYTKCVFAKLNQSGTNVQISANTSIYSGAAYRTGNYIGQDLSTGSSSMGLASAANSYSGYGISSIFMSGKVNFTGVLSYSGNTTLSSTTTSGASPYVYAFTSKGTQEITDASSAFPAASTVVNNGLVILNRATALTIASNMNGTEDILQVGAPTTLTGACTHTGNTIIDLNKSLIIGNGATSGSITGNVINYGTITFDRSDNSSYAAIISGSGALVKNGSGEHTLTALQTYTGTTTINSGKLIISRDVPAISSASISGAGGLVLQPTSNSFTSAVSYPIAGITVGSIGGLTLGKTGNTSGITISSATTVNGPVTIYGGTIALNAALSTTNTSTGDLSLNGTALSGSSTLTVANGRTLTFNLGTNTTYAGSIVGTGLNLVKDGAGILALTASNTPTFANVTISGGTYRLNTNQQLTLSGVLTNNGTFTMRDGATLVQATSGTSITGSGTYNVQKYVSGNSATWNTTSSGRYWYMGVPMSSTTRNAFGAYNINSNRVWSYSEATKQYTHLTDNNAALNAGTGYVHRRATNDTLTFTATGANGLYGADFSLTNLTRTSGVYSGYHLITNPYMAYLDWNAINKTNIEPTYYIRSNNAGVDISALISYNAGTNLYTNTSSVTTTAGQLQYLAPLQSIWIRVGAAAATGGLTMDRTMLSHQSGNPGLKNTTIFPTLARVNLQDGARFDQLLVYMNSDMTNGVDQYDSEKMFVSGAPQIYTVAAGKKLVMNGLKDNKKKISVPLYLELPESKIYKLQLAEYILEDGLILLEDKQEGTIQDFTIHDEYTFYANSGVLANRFVLHFYMPDNGITAQGPSNSWVEEETVINEGGNILVNSNGRGKVSILQDIDPSPAAKGNVIVRDAAGRQVWKGQLSGSATSIELDTPSGIYFVEVELNGQVEMKKIFVQ